MRMRLARKGRHEAGAYLADVRERRAAAPLDDSVHELDLERLDVVVLVDGQL